MESGDGGFQCLDVPVIGQHVVGVLQPLGACHLSSHDATHFISGETAALDGALDLLLLCAVDDEHSVDKIALSPCFEQQRHDDEQVRFRRVGDSLARYLAYAWMQYCF